MAGCGTSCRRLRGEGGIKVEPDCCGGCVVSLDPASIPPAPGGITEQKAKEIADAAAKTAVDAYAVNDDHTSLTPDQTKQIAEDTARTVVDKHAAQTTNVHGIPDTAELETKAGAQAKADAAREAAVRAADEALKAHLASHSGGITAEQAQTIADAAAKAAVDEHLKNHTGGGLTPEQARQIADEAAKAAVDTYAAANPPGISEEKAKEIADAAATAAAQKGIKEHIDTCHTLTISTDKSGITPEAGWEVDLVELRSIGGSHTAFIRLNRTGENITSKDAEFLGEQGQHEEGNIVPDLLIATAAEQWRPPQTYLTSAHTSYGSGSVRIHPTGEIYLLDWMTNNVLQTGHKLRFEYEFLTQTACETGETGPGPAPIPGGLTEEKAREIADAAAKKAADEHAAQTKNVHGIPDTAELETKAGAQTKADAAERNALESLHAVVEKCLTLKTETEGVIAEEGWEVKTPEHNYIGGVHTVLIRLLRTGDTIRGEDENFRTQEGVPGEPGEGNVVPDLLICTVPEGWRPPTHYFVSAHTAYTSGSVRIEDDGKCYLLDLESYLNPLWTGQTLRFHYTFLTEPECAAAIKDVTGTPDATVKPDPADPSGRTALLTIADDRGRCAAPPRPRAAPRPGAPEPERDSVPLCRRSRRRAPPDHLRAYCVAEDQSPGSRNDRYDC